MGRVGNLKGEKNRRKPLGVDRNVLLLGMVSLLNDMSSEMIAPVIPGYLIDVLGAGKLLGGSVMGAIESLSSLFKVVFGYVSDRFRNRKSFILLGYALSTLSRGALAFTRQWWDFLLLRALDRMGKGIRTAPRDALIAESSEGGKTGRSFGFHRMMDTLGAVAGPLLAIALIEILRGLPEETMYRRVFLLAMIPGLLSLLVITLFVKDRGGEVRKKIESVSALKDRRLQLFLVVVAIGALGRYSYAFTLWKAGELGYTVVQGIAFYFIFNLVYALASYPIGIYSDGFGKRRLMTIGFLMASASSLAFAYARDFGTLLLAFLLYGFYTAIEDTVPRAYMADLAGKHERGKVIGAYHTVFGVFVFPASVIAGWLWQVRSLEAAFLYSAAMNLLAFVMMIRLGLED
ncbi:MFS transporter [Thermococcus sp.]|uniref:MFS transporter n=1 Tax=Thermococcus sp. TaxID=35749 RepID=UPI00262D533A|nr:MFS transporter [Thermococcus sp.]